MLTAVTKIFVFSELKFYLFDIKSVMDTVRCRSGNETAKIGIREQFFRAKLAGQKISQMVENQIDKAKVVL